MLPRNAYPRPDLTREDNWINLNGAWAFAFDFGESGMYRQMWAAPAEAYPHTITVPFAPESKLSGIEYVDFISACWYRRTVTIPAAWQKERGRILLHFGAVDYRCTVFVNGVQAGGHIGGYTPFTLDITEWAAAGENTIAVYCQDHTRDPLQPTGKQVYRNYYNEGCDYTRTTGIWQTVWMEYVPKTYVRSLKITPHLRENGTDAWVDVQVRLEGASNGLPVTAEASFGGEMAAAAKTAASGGNAFLRLELPAARLWDVGVPNLYDLTLTAGEDRVGSYFGVREIRINGYALEINRRPVFQRLVLDQGFYPDGIYTAPDDDALRRDIELSMAVGFNGARLHMKVFEPRLLYHADRAGYLLWGEFPNWGLDDSRPEALLSILPEWLTELERDYNHPAIIGWCPFNETGVRRNAQMFRAMYEVTHAIDPTRPVIDSSGYVHAITDIYDVHNYEQDPAAFAEQLSGLVNEDKPVFQNFAGQEAPYRPGQPYFVSEFGGTYWNIDEDPSAAWGYGNAPQTIEEFYTRFEGLTGVLLQNPRMCAYCYTQLTDVFQEKNGIYAFDRRAKFDAERLRRIQSRRAAIEKN